MLKGDTRGDNETGSDEDGRASGECITGGAAPEFATDCDRKAEMKSGVAGTWMVGVFLYDRTVREFSSMESNF